MTFIYLMCQLQLCLPYTLYSLQTLQQLCLLYFVISILLCWRDNATHTFYTAFPLSFVLCIIPQNELIQHSKWYIDSHN